MKRFLKIILAAIIAVIALASVVLIFPSYHKFKSVKEKENKTNTEVELKKAEYIKLKAQLNNLNNNTEEVEKIAREKYNMAKEDETIYKFKKPELD